MHKNYVVHFYLYERFLYNLLAVEWSQLENIGLRIVDANRK